MSTTSPLIGNGECFGPSTKLFNLNLATQNLSPALSPPIKNGSYRKADLLKGDTSKVEIQTNETVIDWQDQWVERWNHGLL